jgi:hypothetical protein
VETDLPARLHLADRGDAMVNDGRHHYLGVWTEQPMLRTLLATLLAEVGMKTVTCPTISPCKSAAGPRDLSYNPAASGDSRLNPSSRPCGKSPSKRKTRKWLLPLPSSSTSASTTG